MKGRQIEKGQGGKKYLRSRAVGGKTLPEGKGRLVREAVREGAYRVDEVWAAEDKNSSMFEDRRLFCAPSTGPQKGTSENTVSGKLSKGSLRTSHQQAKKRGQ